jgi:hypothetical protein
MMLAASNVRSQNGMEIGSAPASRRGGVPQVGFRMPLVLGTPPTPPTGQEAQRHGAARSGRGIPTGQTARSAQARPSRDRSLPPAQQSCSSRQGKSSALRFPALQQ